MQILSPTWTLLEYTGYAINIGLNLKNITEDWKALQEDHHSTTKVLIFFDLIMNCIDIGATGYTFYNKRSENTSAHYHTILKSQFDDEIHQQGIQLADRAFQAWHSSEFGEAIPPLSMGKAQEVFEKLFSNAQAYRQVNFRFEIAQGISLLTRLISLIMKNGFVARIDLIVQLILEKATTILTFHSKVYCNINLQSASNVSLSPLTKISNIVSFVIGISMIRELILGPIPIRVEGFQLIPFNLPKFFANVTGYPKIPAEHHNLPPFNQYLCVKTRVPITKALFIWKKEKLYLFEKEALLADIFASNSAAGPWKIPGTEITFVANEIYEDQGFDGRIARELTKLRAT